MTVETTPSLAGSLARAARLDLTEAAALRQSLLDRCGRAATLDASGVTLLGGLCLQVLLCAGRDWQALGLEFRIHPRSAAFDAALSTFSVPLWRLESKAQS